MDSCSYHLPVLDFSKVFTFLESDNKSTTYEIPPPYLDELFQIKPQIDNGTTNTTTYTPAATTTRTKCSGAKLVLDRYTFMKKRDLKNRWYNKQI
jgi:hypothetical protein